MKMIFITFRSITPAQRGQRLLQQKGIESNLQRTPRWMEEQGCGYCLRLRTVEPAQAVRLLQDGLISFSKVYVSRQGRVEELAV